jgi:hypothetical protein
MLLRASFGSLLFLSLFAAGCGAGHAIDDTPFEDDQDTGTGTELTLDGDLSETTLPSLDAITLEPQNATIFIDTTTGKAATQTYKAFIGTTDVSSTAAFTVDDPVLGTFSGATFTSALTLPGTTLGVTTNVHATAEGKSGLAKLTIVKLRKTPDSTGKKDFFFTVPYKKAPDPAKDVLKFSTNIQKVDVVFDMDTTGSMGTCISNLKTALTSSVIPGLSSIPSVGYGVVDHRDFGDSWVVKVRQQITTDPKLANTAVGAMSAGGGGDEPEAQLASMHYIITGAANSGSIPAYTAKTGFGAVEFRPGAVPVVVLITDAHWHDPSGIATTTNVLDAFKKNNVKFVGINAGYKGGVGQSTSFSNALGTGSAVPPSAFGGKCGAGKCCTGYKGAAVAPNGSGMCPLVFDGGTGDGVSDSVVTAIKAISVGSSYDITYKLSNDPANAKGPDGSVVDATKFIKYLRAMKEGDTANGCPPNPVYDSNSDGVDDTFKSITVGTPVCFEVIPQMNETVPPLETAQFFNAFIDMIGMPGAVNLGDKRTVVFLVPPKDPGIK